VSPEPFRVILVLVHPLLLRFLQALQPAASGRSTPSF
jgi:hypothetical protein